MHGLLHHVHQHNRKQAGEQPSGRTLFIDRIIYVVSVVGPLTVVPQLYDVWANGGAAGVSVLSWTLFTLINMCWVTYGFYHREKPIIISGILYIICNGLVVVGALINR